MLPRPSRLKRNRDFQNVYKRRQSWASPHFVLYIRVRTPREETVSRLGFVISKKIARRAHDRNRLKRRLREICRLQVLPCVSRPIDGLFVARAGATEANFGELSREVAELVRQAGVAGK